MEICQVIIKYSLVIDLRELRSDENHPFNRRNVAVLSIFLIYFIMISDFLLFYAKTFLEYAQGLYLWLPVFFVGIGLLYSI